MKDLLPFSAGIIIGMAIGMFILLSANGYTLRAKANDCVFEVAR